MCRHREKRNRCHRASAKLCRAELSTAVKHKAVRRPRKFPLCALSPQGSELLRGEEGYQESPTEVKEKKIQGVLSGRGNEYVYSWRTMQQCNVLLKKKIIIISLDTSEDCIATLVGHTVGELHWGGQRSAGCRPPCPPLAPLGSPSC